MSTYTKSELNRITPRPSRAALATAAVFCLVVVVGYAGYASIYGLLTGESQFRVNIQAINILAISLMMGVLIVALHRRDQILEIAVKFENLRQNSANANQWIIQSSAIIAVTDTDGFILYVNRVFEEAFDYTQDEVVGENACILYEDGKHDYQFAEVSKTTRLGDTWSGEQSLRKKDGSLILVQGTILPIFDHEGRHTKTVAIRTDVTSERTAEAGDNMTSLLRKLQDEVFIFRADNLQPKFLNDLALHRCGLKSLDGVNQPIHEIISGLDEELIVAHTQPLISGDQQVALVSLTSDDGKEYEMSTRLHRGMDEIPVYVSILRDITERRLVDEARLASVSIVSHELRTPLTSIKGSLRLLMSGVVGELPSKARDMLVIADRNSDRLLTIVNDILDYEKLQAGKMELEFAPVDLTEFVLHAIENHRGYASQHGVELGIENSHLNAIVEADNDRLMQVMSNILSNAIKFSPESGKVVISITQTANHCGVIVSDQGPGIPDELRSDVFANFSQIEPADGRRRVGTGLGMAISRRIIEEHGGTIDFVSEIGCGSDFFFTLPLKRPLETSAAIAKKRVLSRSINTQKADTNA
ncbi:MAG: PAS domain-containing sensor histidine kinase [Gammaproteobacteria bacterium]|nr:PAS domain-containing sensor histidine kinase [Gammaproteobacteria bacterium]